MPMSVNVIKSKFGDFLINLGDFVKNWYAQVQSLRTEIDVSDDLKTVTGVMEVRIKFSGEREELESWLEYVAKSLGAERFELREVFEMLGIYDIILVFAA